MMRASMIAVAALVLMLALPMRAGAQESVRLVDATLTPLSATVGDRLTLRIEVEHPPGVTVEGPRFDAGFGGLDVVEIAEPELTGQDGQARTTLVYVLTAFRPGPFTVPPLDVEYRGADTAGRLTTPALSVDVRSVLAPGETELRPLKPQLTIPDEPPPPVVPVVFVASFALLTVLGYVLVRRAVDARPTAPQAVPMAPPTPYEAARASLDALVADNVAATDPHAYYATLAGTVRRYLSARFDFPAYAMTRRELERGVRRAGVDRWPARLTANLLEECDAVQFAGFRPAPERMEADLTAAYEIVELTAGEARGTAAAHTGLA
jgi:hypothetical protein